MLICPSIGLGDESGDDVSDETFERIRGINLNDKVELYQNYLWYLNFLLYVHVGIRISCR